MRIEGYTVLNPDPPTAPRFRTRRAADEYAELNGGHVFPVVTVSETPRPAELRVLEVEVPG